MGDQSLQVNHCGQPDYANFGVPARTEPGKTGPSYDRDMNYKVYSTNKGQMPSLKCKVCGDNPPMKSNSGITEEAKRLMMKASLSAPQQHGEWRDEWFEHPLSTMNEPSNAMSWLTCTRPSTRTARRTCCSAPGWHTSTTYSR